MLKQKYSLQEQIQHMEKKGITFDLINHDEAKSFLQNNNYYFRIKSYAKNYDKYSQTKNRGRYINLDFDYLKELSIIDMHLRRLLLRMTIDIEHTLKVNFLDGVLNKDNNDGYKIVQNFFTTSDGRFIKQQLEKFNQTYSKINTKSRSYTSSLSVKYHPNYPIWCIVELLSFGDFIRLYNFYYYTERKMKSPYGELLWSTRIIRNAAAHNNCLLNNLSHQQKTQTSNLLRKELINSPKTKTYYHRYKDNYLILDILSVYYLYNHVITNIDARKEIFEELKTKVVARVFEKDYFRKNTTIRECFELFSLALESLKNSNEF